MRQTRTQENGAKDVVRTHIALSKKEGAELVFFSESSSKPRPLVLYFHGGTQKSRRDALAFFAKRGMHTAVSDGAGRLPFPKNLEHAERAFLHFAHRQSEYNITGILLAGDGVGAFLSAMLLNTLFGKTEAECLKGVMLFSGVYDVKLLLAAKTKPQKDIRKKAFGLPSFRTSGYDACPHKAALSPLAVVSSWGVPVLLASSLFDTATLGQGQALAEELARYGVPNWEIRAAKHQCKHNWHLAPNTSSYARATLEQAVQFIKNAADGKEGWRDRYIEI